MKVLKIIGIIILVLILIIAVLALIAPKSYEVSRSIVINADKEIVFRQMQYWRNWTAWSPWAEKDSTMKITVEGIDGEEGSKYIWEGDPKITGSGEMLNTGVIPNEEMTYHLHFKTPWESHSDGYVRVEDADTGTKASWGFYGKERIPMNIMLLFMSMDKMMGPDFEHGMELLKKVCEAKASKMVNLQVQEMDYKAANFAAVRKEVNIGEITTFFEPSYAAINKAMQASGATMTGPPSAIYFKWDEENGVTDVAAAIPTRATVNEGEVQMINVPKSKALAIDFYGPYDEIELAHFRLLDYMKKHEISPNGLFIEEYLTDPTSLGDPNKWLTRVIYLID